MISLKWLVFTVLQFLARDVHAFNMIPSVQEYFPGLTDDLTLLTWAHAVNNQKLLAESIADPGIMMLEADVSLGTLNGGSGDLIPIMAHPPTNVSDLSLQQFIESVVEAQEKYKKGIKLDFKTTEVFKVSWSVLDMFTEKFTFPVWINADIIQGPVHSTGTPVDPDVFLQMSSTKLPTTTLSLGWTTNYGLLITGSYTVEQLYAMKQAIVKNNIKQPITFAVRAGITALSKDGIIQLVNDIDSFQKSNQTSLTIWQSNDIDPVDVDKLRDVIYTVKKSRVFLDVPEFLRNKLNLTVREELHTNGAPGVIAGILVSLSTLLARVF